MLTGNSLQKSIRGLELMSSSSQTSFRHQGYEKGLQHDVPSVCTARAWQRNNGTRASRSSTEVWLQSSFCEGRLVNEIPSLNGKIMTLTLTSLDGRTHRPLWTSSLDPRRISVDHCRYEDWLWKRMPHLFQKWSDKLCADVVFSNGNDVHTVLLRVIGGDQPGCELLNKAV